MHQVAAREQLVGREHAVQRLARDAHEARVARAGADEHGMETHLVDHLLDGEEAPDQCVALEFHAELLELADLGIHDRVRQAEVRNAVLEHAARLVEGLVDRDITARLGHVGRARHAGGAGSDDADAEQVALDVRNVRPALLDGEVADPPLQPADGHGLERVAYRADALALVFLGAHTPADRRQQVCPRDDVVGSAEILLGDPVNEVRNGDVDRAAADAGLVGAHQAALRFQQRVLDQVAVRDLQEVARALLRILLARRRPRLGNHPDRFLLFRRCHGTWLRRRQLSLKRSVASRSVAL